MSDDYQMIQFCSQLILDYNQLVMRMLVRPSAGLWVTSRIIAPFCAYKYPYNINVEEHANYLKKVGKAEKQLKELSERSLLPRRKRRVYDRPKYDLNLNGYAAWRLYDPNEMLFKFGAHNATVMSKLWLSPRWLIHAFGIPLPPMNHQKSSSMQFSFEDNNLSKFLLFQYRNTTQFKPNDPKFDYNNQEKLRERDRKRFRLTKQQFWNSQQLFEFRLNCSAYGEHLKFKNWVETTIEACKKKPSYDSFIDEKYGPVLTYNKKEDSAKFVPFKPAILSLTPAHFAPLKKGEKLKQPKVELPQRLGEQHRIKHNSKVLTPLQKQEVQAEANAESK